MFLRIQILGSTSQSGEGLPFVPANVMSSPNSSLTTERLRDLMEKVYIYQHALLSATDIVSRDSEESLEFLQDRVSSQDLGVGCAGVSVCWCGYIKVCTHPHLQTPLRARATGGEITTAVFKVPAASITCFWGP